MDETENSSEQIRHSKKKLPWLFLYIGIPLIILVVGLGFMSWHLTHNSKPTKSQSNVFPTSVISQMHGFTFYYFKPSFSTNFVLEPNSISYQQGVLVFGMKDNAGKTLAITEEATPPGYDISALQADKQYNNEFGSAYITDAVTRTTGALFTNDHTWILINSPQPIGSDLMQQMLDALVPTK